MTAASPFPDLGQTQLRNQELTDRLFAITGGPPPPYILCSAPPALLKGADAIVAHIEINNHHGVGVLIQRLFEGCTNLLSIRSKNFYDGIQDFGAAHICISHGEVSRDIAVWNVLEALPGVRVQRVICVPYFPDDALTAVALKEAFGVPLCTFLMDDQNLYSDGIPNHVMADLLSKSSLRLAISPQLCAGYEAKFGHKIWFMPPVAPANLIPQRLNELPEPALREQPVIVGNIWGQHWLDSLRTAVRRSGVTLRWYNNGEFRWLQCSKEELVSDGIIPQEGAPDPDEVLVEILRKCPLVVVPSGTLSEADDRRFIAQLSFPSRIPYIIATSHTPILVVGDAQTAAAQIVTRLGIGMVAPYNREAFVDAVQQMRRPEVNLAMRRRAFTLSNGFSDRDAAAWLFESLHEGAPTDTRYEDLRRMIDGA